MFYANFSNDFSSHFCLVASIFYLLNFLETFSFWGLDTYLQVC